MSEWVSAAIGAGSAIVGGIATGWFTRNAGHRQADAAQHAGDRQADALLSTVQATLDEQRAQSRQAIRRGVYVQFLDAVGAESGSSPLVSSVPHDHTALSRAFMILELEGPDEVVTAAQPLLEAARALSRRRGGTAAFDAAREAFVQTARAALAS
ncbi:hypothetical protein [Streptomyces sp. NPDC046631]|uniref:hypothetical protein n=1 Tax=unclassified Streptomyces TaxID=2593676 RepID=UPI0033FD9ACB